MEHKIVSGVCLWNIKYMNFNLSKNESSTGMADSANVWHFLLCLSHNSLHLNMKKCLFGTLAHIFQKRTLIPWLQLMTFTFGTLTAQNCEQMMCCMRCSGAVCGWKQYFFVDGVEMWICLYSIQTWLPQMIHADIPLSMDNSTLDMWFTEIKPTQCNSFFKSKNAPLMLFSEAHYLIISWNCWQQLVYLHHLLTLLCGQCINGVHECLWQLVNPSSSMGVCAEFPLLCS